MGLVTTLPAYRRIHFRIMVRAAARHGDAIAVELRQVPVDDSDVWGYSVRPATWETLICFDEPQLAPTGRRARERPVARQIVSVRPDGTVTGYWSR